MCSGRTKTCHRPCRPRCATTACLRWRSSMAYFNSVKVLHSSMAMWRCYTGIFVQNPSSSIRPEPGRSLASTSAHLIKTRKPHRWPSESLFICRSTAQNSLTILMERRKDVSPFKPLKIFTITEKRSQLALMPLSESRWNTCHSRMLSTLW